MIGGFSSSCVVVFSLIWWTWANTSGEEFPLRVGGWRGRVSGGFSSSCIVVFSLIWWSQAYTSGEAFTLRLYDGFNVLVSDKDGLYYKL